MAQYFAIAALIYVVSTALMLLVLVRTFTPPADGFGGGVLVAVLWLLLFAALTYFPLRLILIFPALAVADGPVPVGALWSKTRGNFWRLLVGAVCCFTPAAIALVLLEVATAYGLLDPLDAVREVVDMVLIFVTDVIGVGFVSVAYRELGAGE